MRVAYFDPFSGVSGDMVLGALIDAGANVDALRSGLRGLDLDVTSEFLPGTVDWRSGTAGGGASTTEGG